MDGIRRHRRALTNVTALVLPLGVAAILTPFRASFAGAAAALVLVAVIVAVAAVVLATHPSKFGLDNPNHVFVPIDEPHGTIEATVER